MLSKLPLLSAATSVNYHFTPLLLPIRVSAAAAASINNHSNPLIPHRRHVSTAACGGPSPTATAINPEFAPLFLRPLLHVTTPADLAAFRRHALAASGTDADLARELRWLLEDAAVVAGDTVQLRLPLNELYLLWRERVENRRPFQYIVGCEHWRDMIIGVREGVLIPRPETEMIVDMVREVEGFGEGVWADLGTGSGAIAVAIGKMVGEKGRVVGVDVSAEAVEVARWNVARYGLQEKVEIRQGSWFEPLEDVKGKLTGLVSNPPYIPSRDISGLQAEVGKHEPRLALDGGENGLDYLIHLCEGSAAALRPSGFFAFETNGDMQSEFLADLLTTKFRDSFNDVKIVPDFAKIKRFVTGFRR